MKVFVVGIAGATGLRLATRLIARGDEVGGLYRRAEQRQLLEDAGVSGTMGELVALSEQELASAMAGSDVVVFSAGAGGRDGEAMTDKVDGDGL